MQSAVSDENKLETSDQCCAIGLGGWGDIINRRKESDNAFICC